MIHLLYTDISPELKTEQKGQCSYELSTYLHQENNSAAFYAAEMGCSDFYSSGEGT